MSVEAVRIGARRPARRIFVHQLRSEQLVFWRSREAAFFIFLFPLLLFVLLGSVYSGTFQGVPVAWGVLAGLIGYGCANTAFAGLAIQVVLRRENGREIVVETDSPTRILHELTEKALAEHRELEGLAVTRPTLEDVYLSLTEDSE